MKKVAFIFPGQGSQTVGMGKDFFENSDIAKDMISKASERLGINFELGNKFHQDYSNVNELIDEITQRLT